VAARTFSGFLVLAGAASVRRPSLPRTADMWLHIAVVAVIGNVAPWAMVAWAQRSITSSLTAVLYSLIPMITLILSTVVGAERITARRVAGLLVGLAGSVVVIGWDADVRANLTAVTAVLAACVLLSAGAVYAGRFLTSRVKPLPMVTMQLGIACVTSTAVALVVDGSPVWELLTTRVVAAAVALGALGTGVAFLLYYGLIGSVGATNASLVTYLIPVVGVGAGWAILGERVSSTLLMGCAVIISGVWITQRSTTPLAAAVVE